MRKVRERHSCPFRWMVGHCSVRTTQATGEEREKTGGKKRRGERGKEGERGEFTGYYDAHN